MAYSPEFRRLPLDSFVQKNPLSLSACGLLDYSSPELVPTAGLEPARLASPPPQDGVSTNFTTSALYLLLAL